MSRREHPGRAVVVTLVGFLLAAVAGAYAIWARTHA